MAKHTIQNLDAGQLDMMWNMIKVSNKCTCTKSDVQVLKRYLDKIRQAMIQKVGKGERKGAYVPWEDLGTYINLAIVSALTLYVYGGLDVLEKELPEKEEK